VSIVQRGIDDVLKWCSSDLLMRNSNVDRRRN